MKQTNIKSKNSKGLTLMELMIAMVIGLMLLGGALSMFVNNKRVYRQVNEVGRLQENARFALEMMTRDIRMAGFNGCHHSVAAVNNYIVGNTTDGSLFDHTHGIEGIEGGATAWSPSAHAGAGGIGVPFQIPGDKLRYTDSTIPDAITVRYLSGEFWDVVDDNDPGADNFEGPQDSQYMANEANWAIVSTADAHPDPGPPADRANDFAPAELLAVTDCASSDIFQLTTQCASLNTTYTCANGANGRIRHELLGGAPPVPALPGNSGGSFTKNYQQGTKVRRYIAVRYYIGNGDYGGPSLFRQFPVLDVDNIASTADDFTATIARQELIEGVENMQLMYGVDTDEDGIPENYYVAGAAALDDPAEWGDVVSVKIALLIRTVDTSFGSDTKTYAMLGQNVDPIDIGVRRRVFTNTIQIRNRISR